MHGKAYMMMKPHFESFSSNSSSASTWNRLSHMYRDLILKLPFPLDKPSISENSRIDRFERLERKRYLLLLAFIVKNRSDKDTKPIIRNPVVQLELLLRRGDS